MNGNDHLGYTLILGIGNSIMGDEGFGIRVIQGLKDIPLPADVKIAEGGVGGFNLLGLLDGVKRIIVVDIMNTQIPPGEIKFFKPAPDFAEPGKRIVSFHQVGILELVQMWDLLGYKAEVYYIVTRPVRLEWSTELSPPVQLAANKAIEMIKGMIRDNFAMAGRKVLCIW